MLHDAPALNVATQSLLAAAMRAKPELGVADTTIPLSAEPAVSVRVWTLGVGLFRATSPNAKAAGATEAKDVVVNCTAPASL